MNAIRTQDVLDLWKRLRIDGNADQITKMLGEVEKQLKGMGFDPETARENRALRLGIEPPGTRCFLGGPTGGACLRLCLTRVSEHRVGGGSLSVLAEPIVDGRKEVEALVAAVLDQAIIPTANRLGLRINFPQLGPRSLVPVRTMAALSHFGDISPGKLPLSPEAEVAWRRFLVTASREEVAFDPDELTEWFIANGWGSDDSVTLTNRFMSEATLLAEYAEAIGS